jgi:hypothetical protein
MNYGVDWEGSKDYTFRVAVHLVICNHFSDSLSFWGLPPWRSPEFALSMHNVAFFVNAEMTAFLCDILYLHDDTHETVI